MRRCLTAHASSSPSSLTARITRVFFRRTLASDASRRPRRRDMGKHQPQAWVSIAAAHANEQDDARAYLINLGARAEDVDDMLEKHPRVRTYDVATEIAPRMSYLSFLEERGELKGETAVACALRQPGVLERKYETVFECAQRGFIAVHKPFAVRLDTPRGWSEKTEDGTGRVEKVRFIPRWDGDASCEDWLNIRFPDMHHRFCHQLDTATSGVVLTANTREAAGSAAKLFRERRAKKRYLAVVFGWPENDEWTVEAKLSKDPDDVKGFKERVDEENGKASETSFTVIQRGYCALEGRHFGAKVSRVECRPVTGRRHQIRLHLMHSGHSILGDQAYSEDSDSFRMFLHALELKMPFADETLTFATPPPPSFEEAVSAEPLA